MEARLLFENKPNHHEITQAFHKETLADVESPCNSVEYHLLTSLRGQPFLTETTDLFRTICAVWSTVESVTERTGSDAAVYTGES